jgi:ankyrin repeat protein
MQMNGGHLLHATAFHGHEEATSLLLQAGVEVNGKAANGGTALHYAALLGHEGVARLLVS